jgi:putative tryptophan/tyrosine transport system substrate-binding protein
MRRRDFITRVGSGAAAWPLAASAQQSGRIRHVGIFMATTEDDSEGRKRTTAFVQGLRELGWIAGDNIQLDYGWAAADAVRARGLAAKLIELKPDAILADTALCVAPLRESTQTIPIVFVEIADPVGSGFVASLARPGGNITGFTPFEFSLSGKLLEVLKEVAPQVNQVDVIYNQVQVPQFGMLRAVEAAGTSLGVQVNATSASNADEITHIIEGLAGQPGAGVIVLANPVNTVNRGLIIALTARYHLPAAYPFPYFARDGGLVAYGIDPAMQFHDAASYVDRVLKGAKPADLPVQQPIKFQLAINLKTAKSLGLEVPTFLQQRADELIE